MFECVVLSCFAVGVDFLFFTSNVTRKSFATAESVESYYALKTGELPVLSEQTILDCTNNTQDCGGTGGCGVS